MIGLIVCTHGKFSEELVRASEMMFGRQDNLQYLTFEPGESAEDLVDRYKAALNKLEDKQAVLFLVDLFGGSPYNAAGRVAAENQNSMDVVTGVNLPMLLEIYGTRKFSSLPELVDIAMSAGSSAIKSFRANFDTNAGEDL
ncbi:PTS sugar transporter subunit IIA [Propionispora vibrioides]|uniref:PTS system D-mannose-specific IIA component, Man family n=1 Tax=Propionispora vibrioides TaxID=112903 RepID=A0A1H8RMN0_9FIRM|nr:mannose/fructose/sorbose PTS transporter subunit IIA [Propionispora vibrioides]SEO67592.1 PTS system D-mannose-specific IIA component, Man family [Propionispora vibrioides]